RALCSSPRNVPDRVLERLRGNGGVCMAAFAEQFVSQEAWDWRQEAAEAAAREGIPATDLERFVPFSLRYAETHPQPRATLEQVVAHIEHLREVAGVDHVGIGGDYDGVRQLPVGLEDVSCYPRLFAALADRGWSDEDLVKLAGVNVLRVLRDAEAVSRELG